MLRVTIGRDPDVESPLEMSDWKLHSFGRKHINFTDPKELGLSYSTDVWDQPIVNGIGLRRKLECGTAFWCYYYEHGNCIWGLTGNEVPGVEFTWDGVRYAGMLIYEGKAKHLPKDCHQRRDLAKAILSKYTQWCNGEVYYYGTVDESTGDWVDSCGGFIGTESLVEAIAYSVKGHEWEVEEEWEYLVPDIKKFISKETASV